MDYVKFIELALTIKASINVIQMDLNNDKLPYAQKVLSARATTIYIMI